MQIVNNTLFIIVSILFLSLFGTLVFIAVDGLITYYRSKKVLANSDKYLEYLSEYRKQYENVTDINKLFAAETTARDLIKYCLNDEDIVLRGRAKLEAVITRRENLRVINSLERY